jgi:nitrate reductase NapE
MGDSASPTNEESSRAACGARSELLAFLFLTVVMAPVIAGVVIGGYGFLVWIYQMFAGPPGS